MSDSPDDPIVAYFDAGIPELGVPPDSVVLWWPFRRKWAHYRECGYDHGVIMNRLESGDGEVILPGPGLADSLLAAIAGHACSLPPSSPDEPPPSPARRGLRLVR